MDLNKVIVSCTISKSEVEHLKKGAFYSVGSHEHYSEMTPFGDDDFCGGLILELFVERLDVVGLKAIDGSQDLYTPAFLLVVDVFDYKSDIFVDQMI